MSLQHVPFEEWHEVCPVPTGAFEWMGNTIEHVPPE